MNPHPIGTEPLPDGPHAANDSHTPDGIDAIKSPTLGVSTTTDSVAADFNQLGNPLGPDQAAIIDSLLQRHVPFYVRLQVSPFEAQAAQLLNEIVTANHPDWPLYHLFFCSSRSEAISGGLKVIRHNRLIHAPTAPAATAVFDPTHELLELYDPLRQGPAQALIPGLIFCDTVDHTLALIEQRQVSSLLIAAPDLIPTTELQELFAVAKRGGIYTILDESRVDLASRSLTSSILSTSPDVILLGENLANHQAPSGCFMMSRDIYRVWNTFGNYNLHSNTWGGNSVSMSLVLNHLKSTSDYRHLSAKSRDAVDQVLASHRLASRAFAKYGNPRMTTMMQLSNLNKDITYASSSDLRVGPGTASPRVIDAAGTYGVNLRGHCPSDYQTAVLHSHDPAHDYWSDLATVFAHKTGLPHLLPAVSGTSANDLAITAALTAQFPRRRIIALEMGYHGKTCISLAATYKPRIRDPFGPLYPDVTFVDPMAVDVDRQLTQCFETGDVALVILETIQGEGGVRSCPQPLLDFLTKMRNRYGYLICVDEVQTGMYRTGRFLNHQGKIENPDLIVVGKGMSDMVFPVAATNLSEAVFRAAATRNEQTVKRLVNQYRCQIGAHTALHAIHSADAMELDKRAQQHGDYFKARLQEIASQTGMVKEIRGEGLMIGFELDPQSLPKPLRGSYGGLIASRFANDPRNPVLVAFNPDKPHLIRFLPPLTISTAEIDTVLETTRRCLHAGLLKLVTPLVTNLIRPRVWFPQSF